ncbi:MAG: HAD family phosphatase [Pseudomonadota bacterium]
MDIETAKKPAIKAVLFDFSGVLAEEGYTLGLAALAQRCGMRPEDLIQQTITVFYKSGYANGEVSTADFWQALREATDIDLDDDALNEVILSCFVIRPAMLKEVDALRAAGMLTAIVSDHTDWLETLDARDDIFSHFDYIFTSYREKANKKTGELFAKSIAKLPCHVEEMLFFDDTAGNIERAALHGLQGCTFINHEQYREDIKKFIPNLQLA